MWPFTTEYPAVHPEEIGRDLSSQDASEHISAPSFDYIIVGGGVSGSVLASRLSENPNITVLLIERGPVADTWANKVPLLSGSLRPETLARKTKSAPFVHGNNRVVDVLRGEGLGGGSRINGMLYSRGVPGDYNKWADWGHPEWSYEKILPYFLKSESSLTHGKAKARGESGPWVNQKPPTGFWRNIEAAKNAAHACGIPNVPDFNDPSTPALATWDVDITQNASRQRMSIFHAFLPADLANARKDRLRICPETLVTRIVFRTIDGRPRAVGVKFKCADATRGETVYFAAARKEVIICGGAIGSPQVLMLSGIGPAEHLQLHGIDTVFNSPGVGSYFKDHLGIPLVWAVPLEDSLRHLAVRPLRALYEIGRYLLTGRGMMSEPPAPVAIFLRSQLLGDSGELVQPLRPVDLDVNSPNNIPDIEIQPIAVDCVDSRDEFIVPAGAFSLLTTVLNTKSFGSVRLKSSDPREYALVDIGLMSNNDDFSTAFKAVRLVLRLAEEMKKQGYPLESELLLPESSSDEDIITFLREHARSAYHYTSSCRMAKLDDPVSPGVVDDELKVYGVDGLRVCDASVAPDIIGAHPMALAVVIAEKCADTILSS